MIEWSKKLIKLYKTAIGQPYVDVKIIHDGDRVALQVDYNSAFIRDLDKHGYADLLTPEDKVGEYLKNILALSFSQDNDEMDES